MGHHRSTISSARRQKPDINLLGQTRNIGQQMRLQGQYYRKHQDFRWFFTDVHASITQRIAQNIHLFESPNALMRLNLHFASAFMRAVRGMPSGPWKKAFAICETLEWSDRFVPFQVGEVEACGAAMARVHINVDLRRALKESGCISPRDYGNILLFIEKGTKEGFAKLRGHYVGKIEYAMKDAVAPLERYWRDSVYKDVCGLNVPDIDPRFRSSVRF